ncbi:hypothetical protein L226DRAFT_567218 [Lentinus tigrinus ALCF2SS1-7]|uniref:Uncharacterized protein n=1 Tax=Lentinus tigrinus ALCF2SS1-6 TaxID=1328759 RepID=A0A5C2SQF4_9APHY|nr:hypothetical protein L227DRAFT_607050 [Lentinus tigrinus ALCF2SS1-6]RPD79022.1 hypothetical protein L226DRAFT_567218 [Lentinus tigrinus ALCF2SS1-7]
MTDDQCFSLEPSARSPLASSSFCWCAGFGTTRRGLNYIMVLILIAMLTLLSVTLAVGAQQLAKYKAVVTGIMAIEELAALTICLPPT